jgi:predicted  nucleic acid-binding Zn-ribbon protein
MSGSSDAFFKIRQTKRSNPEERTTLDVMHQCQIKRIHEDYSELEELEIEIKTIKQKIKETNDDLIRGQMENYLVRLEEDFAEKKKTDRVYDYLLNTGDILFDYYDMQEQISKGVVNEPSSKNKYKPGDVLSALHAAAAMDEQEYADDGKNQEKAAEKPEEKAVDKAEKKAKASKKKKALGRNELLEQYLLLINPEYVKKVNEVDDISNECAECGSDMTFSQTEAMLYCPECGASEFILIDSDRPSYKDPPRESNYYAYKRINHFNELLAQFQAKGSTEIPDDVFDQILAELKKQRITDFKNLKYRQMREVLRKLKLNRQYDHIPFIISRLNGSIAPVMSRETEEKLRHMFKEIQPSFQKHCPKNRRNFLSYSYVLYKFCELLELDEFLASFPLLKNRDKLYQQSKVWEQICIDMSWQYIPTI